MMVNIVVLGVIIDSSFVTDLKVKIKLMFMIQKKKSHKRPPDTLFQ